MEVSACRPRRGAPAAAGSAARAPAAPTKYTTPATPAAPTSAACTLVLLQPPRHTLPPPSLHPPSTLPSTLPVSAGALCASGHSHWIGVHVRAFPRRHTSEPMPEMSMVQACTSTSPHRLLTLRCGTAHADALALTGATRITPIGCSGRRTGRRSFARAATMRPGGQQRPRVGGGKAERALPPGRPAHAHTHAFAQARTRAHTHVRTNARTRERTYACTHVCVAGPLRPERVCSRPGAERRAWDRLDAAAQWPRHASRPRHG